MGQMLARQWTKTPTGWLVQEIFTVGRQTRSASEQESQDLDHLFIRAAGDGLP